MTNISVGFHDPTIWLSTGCYCLNFLVSGDFNKGIPLGKVTIFAGESGAGKSFIVSGNLIKSAQEQGIFVVLIDTENALDETWLWNLGVDTDPAKLMKINAAMIDDVARIISDFVKDYKDEYGGVPKEERPKVMFVIDSLGMLLTPTEVNQFTAGDMKGDMGRKAKQLKALVTNCVNTFGEYDFGLIATQHSYSSQDQYNPDDIISGGSGFIYASSIVVAMKKYKLKEDADGNKVAEVNGIRAKCKVMKTRYNKPFEEVEIKIPYETGMNPYSGMFEFFEKTGFLVKDGNRYKFTNSKGEETKLWRKEFLNNEDGVLDELMKLYLERKPYATELTMPEDAGVEDVVDTVDAAWN